MKTTRRKKSEVTKYLATFLSPKSHFAELHYIAALCIRAAPTAKVRVGHFCGPRVAIPTEQRSLCPGTSQILWRRGKGEQTPLPGGGGTGRRLPTRRRSCPLPGGPRTERSTQGKARAGHGLPGRPCWSDTGEWRPLPTAARPGSQRGGARRAPGPFGREGAPPRSVGTALSGAWAPGRCESGTQRPSRVLVSMTGRRRCCPAGDRVGTAADRAAAQARRRVTACAGHRGGPRPSQPCCHGPHGPGPAGGSVCLWSSSAQLRERRGFRPRTVPEMTSLDSAGYYQNAQVCTGSYVYRLGLNLVLLLLSKNGSLSKESYKSEVNFICRSLISSSNSSPTLTGALPSSLTCINIPVTLSDLHLGYESESHRAHSVCHMQPSGMGRRVGVAHGHHELLWQLRELWSLLFPLGIVSNLKMLNGGQMTV